MDKINKIRIKNSKLNNENNVVKKNKIEEIAEKLEIILQKKENSNEQSQINDFNENIIDKKNQ
jgi:hypothetical protein